MAEVPVRLSDRPALVDDEDLPLVAQHRWKLGADGYPRAKIAGAWVYMHALILDPGPGLTVDHRNRDVLDNRRANLRPATRQQQCANRGLLACNRSGFIGVSMHESGLWRARIGNRHLGYFATAEEAALARDAAAFAVNGEYAVLNFADHAERCDPQPVRSDGPPPRRPDISPGGSGYRGVRRKGGSWEARLCVGNRITTVGSYPTAEDAARAYDAAAVAMLGDKARTNFAHRDGH